MKRWTLFPLLLAAVFLSVVSAGAQTIMVTKPALNEVWIKGQPQPYAITWTKTGTMPNTVRISLRNKASTAVVQEIVDGAPNSGNYQWSVPAGIPDGDYHIRVKVKGADISDDSEVFNISAGQQPESPAWKQDLHKTGTASQLKVSRALVPIFAVDRPSDKDIWIVGKTYTIQWRVADSIPYPLSIFLVTADKKLPVNDLGKALVHPPSTFRPTSKQWTVNDNLYEEQFRIRITSADGKHETYSQPFLVKATWPSDFTVEPSVVVNRAHRSYYHSQPPEHMELLAMGTKLFDPFPDPGAKTSKTGFQWALLIRETSEQVFLRYRHRSYVFFDLAEVKSKMTHAATVKTVQFYQTPAANSPQSCPPQIWCLDAALPADMTADAFANHPKHLLGNDMQVLTWSVQRWFDNPQSFNYGVVIQAADEGPDLGGAGSLWMRNIINGQCIQLSKWELKFRLEEKLTK
jgi:Kre9/KNH-like N-terminal Ig-like domain